MPLGPSIGLAVALALAAPPLAGGGESVAIRVEFDAPPGCSSADTFYGGLLARMNRARRAQPGEAAVRLGVRLTRTGNKVRGELRLKNGPGDGETRRVEGETCDAVVEVLSLTAALALVEQTTPPTPSAPRPSPPPSSARAPSGSPSGSSSSAASPSSSSSSSSSSDATAKPPGPEAAKPPEPEKETEEKKSAADQPAAVAVSPEQKPPAQPRGTQVRVGLQALAADLIAAGVHVGGGLPVRLERSAAEGPAASVGVTFLYASNDLLQNADEVAVRWMALAATGCPAWGLGQTLTLQPCAQAIGGWMSATGRGVSKPSTVGRSWWSVGALARGAARLGAGFSLELDVGVAFPIAKRTFFIGSSPEGTVGETPTVAPIISLGLSRAF